MPEHCREIEEKSLFGQLSDHIASLSHDIVITPPQVERLRATTLPMVDGLILLEALIETPDGPALASYLWQDARLVILDRHIEFLSHPMQARIIGRGMPPLDDRIDFARVFCATLATESWIFWPCNSAADLGCLYKLGDDQRQAVEQIDFAVRPVDGASDGPFEITLAYGPQLFRSILQLLPTGRFEMIEDTPICDLPMPHLLRGPNGWLYRAEGLGDG
jgi:hypothetical protein